MRYVIFLFLQNIRATFLPITIIPVTMLGIFTILVAAGYSVNIITMLGLVLFIGLLIDDAIVMVKNGGRLMAKKQLKAIEVIKLVNA